MSHKKRSTDEKLKRDKVQELSPYISEMFAAALQCHQDSDFHEAEQFYRQVLAVDPSHAESLHLLGVLYHQNGRHDLALDLISRAITINSRIAFYHSNLGSVLRRLGRLDQAARSFRKAISLNPDYAEAHNNLGLTLQELKKFDEALSCFQRAASLKADFPEVYNNLGNLMGDKGQSNDAVSFYQKAIELRPNYSEAYNNLGAALKSLEKLDEAIACYRIAIDLNSKFSEAYSNLGITLFKNGQREEGFSFCRKAIDINPDLPEAHYNLANILASQRNLDEAIGCYRKAIDLRPGFSEAHNNLALSLLTQGDMEKGWQEYEWRWETTRMAPTRRSFKQPQWKGEAAEGRTLLVHAEQGLGDTIQFCRYVELAAAKGLRVVMEVQKPLFRLLSNLKGIERIVVYGEELPTFDLHCPMLSLPLALGTTLANIPSAQSYLAVDNEKIEIWRKRMSGSLGRGINVGLTWAGGKSTSTNYQRSLNPDHLLSLLDIPGLSFFSLQKERTLKSRDLELNDLMEEVVDLYDTAALIGNLDLIISVDTAVAHLAASLGKPVWLLDRFDSDWRWLIGRRDSPWYPTLRIYRQKQPGDWAAVIDEISLDLTQLVKV